LDLIIRVILQKLEVTVEERYRRKKRRKIKIMSNQTVFDV
jgi:hypothetical protein